MTREIFLASEKGNAKMDEGALIFSLRERLMFHLSVTASPPNMLGGSVASHACWKYAVFRQLRFLLCCCLFSRRV
ncbi:hypothetical protein NC652_039513 [Populus alba x Populus x berolinensis]|nr:hypothetical protein NC652_039513 [Populus alba x Populus x berolinensis]